MSKTKYVARTLKCTLAGDDGASLPMGEFTYDEDEPLATYATAAFTANRNSCKSLMVPKWRILVHREDGSTEGYSLQRWVPLLDTTTADQPKKVKA